MILVRPTTRVQEAMAMETAMDLTEVETYISTMQVLKAMEEFDALIS